MCGSSAFVGYGRAGKVYGMMVLRVGVRCVLVNYRKTGNPYASAMNSAFLTLWLLVGQTDPGDADIAQMQGQWEIVQSIEHGKALPAADLEDQFLLIDGRIVRVREGEKAYDLFELKVYPQ